MSPVLPLRIEPGRRLRARFAPWAAALAELFAEMDQRYAEVAGRAGFVCDGCRDNCCRTRFHHHTLAEALYLSLALAELTADARSAITRRAERVVRASSRLLQRGRAVRLMCPVNASGRCQLYSSRPMICRLHGIPSSLAHAGRSVSTSPGCGRFEAAHGQPAVRLDRTPLYAHLADLERRLRAHLDWQGKLRLTVAEIVLQVAPLALDPAGKDDA
jgi:hypothetical protein